MKILLFAIPAALLIFLGCSQPPARGKLPSQEATAGLPGYRDSLQKGLFGVSHIIFGKFCGHCLQNCTIMYALHMNGNASSLTADTSNGYLRGEMKFTQKINDSKMMQLASEVYRNLPKELVISAPQEAIFGCPDCADQCGIYVEIGQGATSRKFRIDTNTDGLEGEVKAFAEFIKPVIEQMDAKLRD
ncbi:MAG TPA: hypothetical protein VFR58_15120 [Flavisolibacter sp.]|nr:hypothetical protein [Flavisolibacter sp.]